MLVAPGMKAKDELVKRCKNVFGLEVPAKDGSISCMITTGLLNRKDVKDHSLDAELKTFDVVLVDEVEYTINPSGEYLFSCLSGASYFYGFSGTADKSSGNMISFMNGLTEVVMKNRDLVKWFGPSLVYRMPLSLDIDKVEIRTKSFNNINFDESDFNEDSNVYMNIMNKLWTDPDVAELVVKIIRKYPKTFIPINNLTVILSNWIDNYFKGVFRVLLVCGEGYIYYDLAGNKSKLNLQQACDKIKNNEVDVIPSTSSGYRALDFPALENILLVQGKVAGVVLQAVGRVARGTHMNIITLAPTKRVPVLTKGTRERESMIDNYYKYCNINKTVIDEGDL